MPDLNTDVSLFNVNNRGANASLQTARNTYNQLLTDMNWANEDVSLPVSPMISASSSTIVNGDRPVEVFNDGGTRLFYTTDGNEYAYTPRSLWMTDGKTATDLTNYLPNNDRNQQVFDIIGKRSDNYLYFTRERIAATATDPVPHSLELWKTNGAQTGTQLVRSWNNINDTASNATSSINTTDSHYIVNDRIYISIPSGSGVPKGFELWESQGTAETTKELVAIRTLVQQTPAGFGKVDPKDYGPLPGGYLNSLTKPIAKVQGSNDNLIYFTLESHLNIYRQPGYSYYEVWTLDQQTNSQWSKVSEFNYYDPLKPQDFIKSHLPNGLFTDRQGAYGLEASNTSNLSHSRDYQNYYLDSSRSALVNKAINPGVADYVEVDFQDGYPSLSHLGYIDLPLQSHTQTVPTGRGINQMYFVHKQQEIWLTPGGGEGAQKIFGFEDSPAVPTINGIYKLGRDQLILMTSQGVKSLKITAQADPTIELTKGNYRALKDLAWEIGGAALAKEVVIPEFDTTGWSIHGIRDYDGDGDVDIFWRNNASGQGVFWQMNGLKFEKGVIAGPQGDYSQWQVKGFGDFDRDGDQDIFWQNSNGLNVIWEMQGLKFKSGTILPTTPITDWYFSGIGNFNGDRNLEVLWRNRDGTLVTWEIQDFKLKSGQILPINVGKDYEGWSVQAVTDFDNDGDSDILWRNSGSKLVVMWEMQAGQLKTGTVLGSVKRFGLEEERNVNHDASLVYRSAYDASIRYGGQVDIDGDGRLDIWWKAPETGRREAWRLKSRSTGNISYAETITREGNRYVA
jgi:FG-GAP-like repeat